MAPVICPVCGCNDTMTRVGTANWAAARFTLLQCAGCSLVWTKPRLSPAELAPYYPDDYWEASTGAGKQPGTIARMQQAFIETRMAHGLHPLVSRMLPGARVLDVGCGSGEALRVLMRAGCSAYGVEASPSAVAQARGTGAIIFQGMLEEAKHPDGFFDGVTMVHVLEHLGDPLATVREVHRILRADGLLLIEVPNIESWGFALFGRRWRALDVPRHLYHFSPESLTHLLSQCGFEVVRLSHFSARTSAAMWAGSIFTGMDPIRFRQREATGRSALSCKLAYLILQAAVLPVATACAAARRGDVISVLARKALAVS